MKWMAFAELAPDRMRLVQVANHADLGFASAPVVKQPHRLPEQIHLLEQFLGLGVRWICFQALTENPGGAPDGTGLGFAINGRMPRNGEPGVRPVFRIRDRVGSLLRFFQALRVEGLNRADNLWRRIRRGFEPRIPPAE